MSQEERSIFGEVIVSAILSKNCICTCVLFRTVSEIEIFHFIGRIKERQDRSTRHVITRAAKCTDVDGGIFGNVLYYVNCTNFVTWTINTGIRNSTYNISFLSTILELYSEIVLSWKPFGIEHMYITLFCLEWPILWPPRILTFPPGTSFIWCVSFISCNILPMMLCVVSTMTAPLKIKLKKR
jgi:hypothetical protein